MTKRGLFISFEGIDGAGKTTQIERLVKRLRQSGRDVLESVEPGGTPIATQIRHVLLDPANQEMSPMTELLLYFAARAQNVHQWIRPALDRGAVIVSDRFTDSSVAYQGAARGLGESLVHKVHEISCNGVSPDLTIFLDIDVPTSAGRRGSADRLEGEPDEFHQRVRDAYLRIATAEPRRFHRIDGAQPPNTIAEQIWELVASRV